MRKKYLIAFNLVNSVNEETRFLKIRRTIKLCAQLSQLFSLKATPETTSQTLSDYSGLNNRLEK